MRTKNPVTKHLPKQNNRNCNYQTTVNAIYSNGEIGKAIGGAGNIYCRKGNPKLGSGARGSRNKAARFGVRY